MDEEWQPETGRAVLRPRRVGRLLEPLRERRFTYAAYAAFLDRLVSDPGVQVVPLRDLLTKPRGGVVLGLRHDVDDRLDSALRLARMEHERGLHATYFVLHSASYWSRPDLVERLGDLQALGHEVGWHNDLVTLEVVERVDARAFLQRELNRLRASGIDISGTAAHGSYWGHALGYSNLYFFRDLPAPIPGFPNVDQVLFGGQQRTLPKGALAEFGFAYEAYHLGEQLYASDSRFDAGGRRWHPDRLDLSRLVPGEAAIVLVHPCHWDTGLTAKYARLARRGGRFLVQRRQARRNTGRWDSAL